LRNHLLGLVQSDVEREKDVRIAEARKQAIIHHQEGLLRGEQWALQHCPEKTIREAVDNVHVEYNHKYKEVRDPTTLVIIDEADRLKMAGLEQMRAIFDEGNIGLVLIGMPGLEKRLVRYPQLYSRVGFVHEFRPLSQADVRQLLREGWLPSGISFPDEQMIDEEAIATLLRIAEGKFRLLHRLLTQIVRVLEINRLDKVSREVVEAARESLVIGTV
jgi:DNA transposition AAA+ family ATPase